MARSTQAQKAQRLNAAYQLLSRGIDMAEAAATLVREHAISLRHAYRYLKEAGRLKQPLPIAEASAPITFKVSSDVIRALRAYAAANKLTLSEVVTRAIMDYVSRARRHG
jgi:hypothetical protein